MGSLGIGLDKWCRRRRSIIGGTPIIPSWFTNSIVCWYDVKKQNTTNEKLKLNPYLTDFSGHERHLELRGFHFDNEDGVNKNGDALIFNNYQCYGISTNQPVLTDYTIICKRNPYYGTYGTVASKSKTNYDVDGAFIFETWELKADYSFGGSFYYNKPDSLISYQTKTSYNGNPITPGNLLDTDTLYIGCTRDGLDSLNGELYAFLLFDTSLTTEHIDWVKKNILGEGDYFLFDDGSDMLFDNGEIVYA